MRFSVSVPVLSAQMTVAAPQALHRGQPAHDQATLGHALHAGREGRRREGVRSDATPVERGRV
jgi:hypothetical protein